jgi:hypothetical protein
MDPGIELFRELPAVAIRLVRRGYRASSEQTGGRATDPTTSRETPAQDARTSFRHPQAERQDQHLFHDPVGTERRDAALCGLIKRGHEVSGGEVHVATAELRALRDEGKVRYIGVSERLTRWCGDLPRRTCDHFNSAYSGFVERSILLG